MVSPLLSIESWKLVEKHDERQTYLQHDGEKFLKPLFQVAKKVLDAPVTPPRIKEQYIDAIEDINAQYFTAQDTKASMQGQFHRYDESAETQLRKVASEEVSRCIGELRDLIDAHITIIETTTTLLAERHDDPRKRRRISNTFEQTIATCTMRAVRDGWFPTFESYYFSLNPGERAVEGRKRREKRLYGSEETEGVADLLAQPRFNQISEQDIAVLKYINTNSSENGHPVIHKLLTEYSWAVSS